VTGRRGIKRRKLLDDLKERRGYSHLMEKPLDRTIWKVRFGRGFGPVVNEKTMASRRLDVDPNNLCPFRESNPDSLVV
jgi:hypothetical protein